MVDGGMAWQADGGNSLLLTFNLKIDRNLNVGCLSYLRSKVTALI